MESLLSNLYRISKRKLENGSDPKVFPKERKGDHRNQDIFGDNSICKQPIAKNDSSKQIQTEEHQLWETTNRLWELIREQENYTFKWKTVLLSIFKLSKFWCKRKYEWSRQQQISENGRLKIKSEIDLVSL